MNEEIVKKIKPLIDKYPELSIEELDKLRVLTSQLSNYISCDLYNLRIGIIK